MANNLLHLNDMNQSLLQLFKYLIITCFSVLLLGCQGAETESSSDDSAPPSSATYQNPYTDSNQTLGLNNQQASYFLNQATFGPTLQSIEQLKAQDNYAVWIDQQMAIAPSYQLAEVKSLAQAMCADKDSDGDLLKDASEIMHARDQAWWQTVLTKEDQLRQRVSLALSQILVISTAQGLGLEHTQLGVASYYDLLIKHAFGNYRDLLTDVSTHPAMGIFLSSVQSAKSDSNSNIHPDENYAREILQLFSIGVHLLNIDGTFKLDEQGKPIPSYTQDDIEQFAKVFTGWNFAGATSWNQKVNNADRTIPMTPWEEYHDQSEKHLLNGVIIPAGQTAEQDLNAALDNIFAHSNVGPFISKQLIQKLIKSNPSSAYIARVATIFNDNGSGIKGDLAAVVKAIYLDAEARQNLSSEARGQLKAPILRFSSLWRAFPLQAAIRNGDFLSKESCGEENYPYYQYSHRILSQYSRDTGQGLNRAPTVFGSFRPSYSPQGEIRNSGYVAPEFQILTENNLVNTTNLLLWGLHNQVSLPPNLRTRSDKDHYAYLDISQAQQRAYNVDSLLDYLDLLLLNQAMSDTLKNILKTHLSSAIFADTEQGRLEKARDAITLIITSPEYLIRD